MSQLNKTILQANRKEKMKELLLNFSLYIVLAALIVTVISIDID